MPILDSINGPSDVRRLSPAELVTLADEVRERLIDVVSKTGGHIGAGLGVVELTVALAYCFDSPNDKIIWDVGHQGYPWKTLTGRNDRMPTLRQEGGLSGFLRRDESSHDHFGAGHAGTAVSAALGMATARDLQNESYKVVAVFGDGAMTCGLSYEGLNNAGHSERDVILVLNDNGMSIAPNVGAISRYLGGVMASPFGNRWRERVKHAIEKASQVVGGQQILDFAKNVEESVKNLFSPGMLFEELGFEYVGPVDGHRIKPLVETLQAARKSDGPTLVHVITKKGKGYEPAEKKPTLFHGVGKFDIETGEPVTHPGLTSYSRVLGDALIRLAGENDRVVAITAAMTEGTGLDGFREAYPDRFYDVGIAEPHAVTFAAGLAAGGIRPVVAIYSTFLQRGYDEIVHDVCLQNLPVVFALDRGGLVGEDGATHHGVFDLSYLRHIPNLTVMAPRNGAELGAMLKIALEAEGPAAIRFPRGNTESIDPASEFRTLPPGRAEVLRDGTDVLLLAIGSGVDGALEAADILEKEGVSAAVIDARFVKPLDEASIVPMAKKTGRVITVEENALQGGFGTAVLECFNKRNLGGLRLRRLGIPDRFIEHGSQNALSHQLGLDAEGIVRAVRDLLANSAPV